MATEPAPNAPARAPGPAPAAASGGYLRMAIAVLVIAGLAYTASRFHLMQRIPEALDWIRDQGVMGGLLFILVYAVATTLFLPGSLLTLGAGAAFGVAVGFPLVSVASTLGATLSFLLGRFFARDWVAAKAATNPRFGAVDAAVGREGRKIVALLRLSPLFPFSLLNYGLGITRVGLGDYILASWLGMMPGTLLYVWLGALAGDVAKLAGGQRQRTPLEWTLYSVGLLATVAVTVHVTRVARRALNERLEQNPAPATPHADHPARRT